MHAGAEHVCVHAADTQRADPTTELVRLALNSYVLSEIGWV
jgi:hypothetical protein